jgi:peptide/nickel transport system substrate-binding protein
MNANTDFIQKVDDYTFQIVFAKPTPGFLGVSRGIAGGDIGIQFRVPQHYMQRFHPKYNPKSTSKADHVEQFQQMVDSVSNFPRLLEDPDRPSLWVWVVDEYQPGQILRMVRNPYCWIVDESGAQLPYFDHVEILGLEDSDRETIKLKILAGEVDVEIRTVTLPDVPLYRKPEAVAKGIEVLMFPPIWSAQPSICFNYNSTDPMVRRLTQNLDFRRAISVAIDRPAINKAAWLDLGHPSLGYQDPVAFDPDDQPWTQYDPEKADELLDKIGMSGRDSEGFRTGPDGNKVTFTLMFLPNWKPGFNESAEIMTQNLREVGIRTIATPVDGRLQGVRGATGEGWTAKFWAGTGNYAFQFFRVGAHPNHVGGIRFFDWWESGGKEGIEPPEFIKDYFKLYDMLQVTGTEGPEAEPVIAELRQMTKDLLLEPGIMWGPSPMVVNKTVRNIWGRGDVNIPYPSDDYNKPFSWYRDESFLKK